MNIPDVAVVGTGENRLICTATFGDQEDGGGTIAFWSLHDLTGKRLTYGYSRGRSGSGMGAMLDAMDNAKAAARRRLRKRG